MISKSLINSKILSSISEITNDYDAYIIDLWGVIHDGTNPYPGIENVINLLNADPNKEIIFLSNAPRRSLKAIETLYQRAGIDESSYKMMITSGEILFQSLNKEYSPDTKYYYLGPDKDKDLLLESKFVITDDIKDAAFIIVTGLLDDGINPDLDMKILNEALTYNKLLICANPDLFVIKQTGEKFLCAGYLAKFYEDMGGNVRYFGKPYLDVYASCFDNFMCKDKKRYLAIGDSFETDIKGANSYGIDSILIASGIHKSDLLSYNNQIIYDNLSNHFELYNAIPNYVMKLLGDEL